MKSKAQMAGAGETINPDFTDF